MSDQTGEKRLTFTNGREPHSITATVKGSTYHGAEPGETIVEVSDSSDSGASIDVSIETLQALLDWLKE